MDFLDPKKQRSFTIRLFIGYILVAIAILFASTLLIMYAYGFRLSRDGRLDQMGLVFVSSQPTGADLYINNELYQSTTNTKLRLVADRYDIRLNREGYRPWQRQIIVEGGTVDHYVYPLLIPNELTPSQVDSYETLPELASQSLDKRWLVVQPNRGDMFLEYDLNQTQTALSTPVERTVPAAVVTPSTKPATWKAVVWADTNRHILMQRTFTTEKGTGSEYILFDRGRMENSRNLTRELQLKPTQVLSLRDQQPDQYYIHDTDSLVLSTASLSSPEHTVLEEEVVAFKPHGAETLLYATTKGAASGKVAVMLRDGGRTYSLRTVNESDTYLLDLARYERDWYVAVGSKHENKVYLYENPTTSIRDSESGNPTLSFVFTTDKPESVSFSANAQFIAVENARSLHVYDAEHVRAYRYELPFVIDKPQTRAKWMDGHRFSYVSTKKQILFEYDKNYAQVLSDALPSLGGFYDRDSAYLYTFVQPEKGATTTHLQATPLRVQADL